MEEKQKHLRQKHVRKSNIEKVIFIFSSHGFNLFHQTTAK